jgi:hypothetical protein
VLGEVAHGQGVAVLDPAVPSVEEVEAHLAGSDAIVHSLPPFAPFINVVQLL